MNRVSLVLIILVGLAGSVLGQTPFFQTYHPLRKSQPVEVNALHQDKKGFLWLGTNNGLFRFDGRTFTHFTDRDSLPDLHVTALAEDAEGKLWIGHRNGMISIMEGGSIVPFETREGSAVEPVSDILFDRKGTLWFSTRNDGLYYYLNERLYRLDEAEGLPDVFVYDLYEDRDGNVWAGTDAGIAICTLKEGKVSVQVLDANQGLPDIIIRKIDSLGENLVGLATEDAGLLSLNLDTREIKPVVPANWSFGAINDFVVKARQVWIATPRNGLLVYDRHIDRMQTYRECQGQSLLSINRVLRDTEGNIWSGTRSGVVRTIGDAIEFYEPLSDRSDNNVLAVAVDGRERIWYSTSDGIFLAGVADDPTAALINRQLKSKVPVISLYVDSADYIWAGLYGDGLVRIHPQTGRIKRFDRELRNGNVLSITGRGNKVWVATLGGSSLIEFAGESYKVTNFGSADGLSSDFIYQVFVDSRGRTWFATDGRGVSVLDERGFHQYQDGLPSQVVYGVAEDSNGDIWANVQDQGLFLFQGGQFVSVPEVKLRDNTVHALAADAQGNLIAFHNFGIDVYNVDRKQMRYWGEESGLRDREPNLNAVASDRFGRVYAGMTRGIVKFSLDNDYSVAVPQPVIDDVRVFGESIRMTDNLRLSYNENNVTIHYLGFWYQNASNLNYLYTLENYDLEWMTTRNQEVTYSRLPPGEYTFRVKVSDTEDFTRAAETSVSFSVSPPFWRTGAFYVLAVATFLIGGYGLIKYRERKLLEDKLILEAKVEARTREIQLKTEEIQAQNEEIMAQAEEIQGINENLEMLVKQRTAELEKKNKALEEYAFINAHKLRSPVASILGLVNLLAKADQKDDTRIIREHLQESADKLDAVVRSITEAIEKADNKYL